MVLLFVNRLLFPQSMPWSSMMVMEIDYSLNIMMDERRPNKLNSSNYYKRKQRIYKPSLKVFSSLWFLERNDWLTYFSAEILVLENEVIVFKSGSDCRFYVVGSGEEVSFLRLTILPALLIVNSVEWVNLICGIRVNLWLDWHIDEGSSGEENNVR